MLSKCCSGSPPPCPVHPPNRGLQGHRAQSIMHHAADQLKMPSTSPSASRSSRRVVRTATLRNQQQPWVRGSTGRCPCGSLLWFLPSGHSWSLVKRVRSARAISQTGGKEEEMEFIPKTLELLSEFPHPSTVSICWIPAYS